MENTVLAAVSTAKVLGEFSDSTGAGVLGQNNAGSGTPVGVRGAVPNSSDGYGLSTTDDARIEGLLDTNENDFVVEAGTTSTDRATNVVLGHASNKVTDSAKGATIAGGGRNPGGSDSGNKVHDHFGTIGGGIDNQTGVDDDSATTANYTTVGGGRDNTANAYQSTVAGGNGNSASGGSSIVGGGDGNTASAVSSAVGGGQNNTAGGTASVVAGGSDNTIDGNAKYATIAGGGPVELTDIPGTKNAVYDEYGTVGGGGNNQAGSDDSNSDSADFATVGGGRANTAKASNATVGGGYDNRATGASATVPGGVNNRASGKYSFAAGRSAEANHSGTFVWADSGVTFSSTGPDQFLINASGGVGIETDSPEHYFSVKASNGTGGNWGTHLVGFESTSTGGDVLALRNSAESNPNGDTNFLTFFDSSTSESLGAVQADGSGGVNYQSGNFDVAEYFPKADGDDVFEAGDVVGLQSGEIVADPAGTETAFIISESPMLTGNVPDEDDNEAFACVALLGQVPVRVRGSVDAGDQLVVGADGHALARERSEREDPLVVGRALADAGVEDETVLTLVGNDGETDSQPSDREQRLADLEAENEQLRTELDERDQRIDELEDRLAAIETQLGTTPQPADD